MSASWRPGCPVPLEQLREVLVGYFGADGEAAEFLAPTDTVMAAGYFFEERELAENQRRPAVDLVVAVSQDLGDSDQSRRPPVLEAGLVLDIPLRNRAADGRARAAAARWADFLAPQPPGSRRAPREVVGTAARRLGAARRRPLRRWPRQRPW